MNKNWTSERRLSFVIHLAFVLIPGVAAIIAAFDLWSFIFGSAWFAIPLVACVEGVAITGYILKLRGIQSPFVPARHFVPLISVTSLFYELLQYLLYEMHQPEMLAWGVAIFIVGLFGTLFVLSIAKVESLFVDPLKAAEEKVEADALAIIQPLREHKVREKKLRELSADLLQLETGGSGKPITVETIQAMLSEALPRLLPAPDNGAVADLRIQLDTAHRRLESAQAELREKSQQLAASYTIERPVARVEPLQSVVIPRQVGASVMTCEVCGIGTLDSTEKGISGRGKWRTHFNGKYACRECRQASGI